MAHATVSAVLEALSVLAPRIDGLEKSMRTFESALRVIAGRLGQTTHLQPAVEALRDEVATLAVRGDTGHISGDLARMVGESVRIETDAISREIGDLAHNVEQLRSWVSVIATGIGDVASSQPAQESSRSLAFTGDDPIGRTDDHPWWREP